MALTGIIAEYNPFHNGHLRQFEMIGRGSENDGIIVLMSPDYVQRGIPAFTDKYTRTRMALECGADLVLELPVRYACADAGQFALGAVRTLDRLRCVGRLSFGCETGRTRLLRKISGILAEEPDAFRQNLSSMLKSGLSYPAARQHALSRYFSDDPEVCSMISQGTLAQPNVILALEYLAALHKTGSRIEPCPVLRSDGGYHADAPLIPAEADICDEACKAAGPDKAVCVSAEAIRKLWEAQPNPDLLRPYIPAAAWEVLLPALSASTPNVMQRYSLLLHYKLLCEENYTRYFGVSAELSSRIRRLLGTYGDFVSFAEALKTRQLTRTHVDRALLHIFLGIEGEPGESEYVRVLGFRKDGVHVLRQVTANAEIPVIVKNADASSRLSERAGRLFRQDMHASHLYQMLRPCVSDKKAAGTAFGSVPAGNGTIVSEYTRSPIIL